MFHNDQIKKSALYIVLIIIGAGLGFILDKESKPILPVPVREKTSGYKFINPLIFTEYDQNQRLSEDDELYTSILDYIDKATSNRKVSDASVYFRKLENGEWISVYPDKTYSPSSLLKVVNMITVQRATESDPALLSKQVPIKPEDMHLADNGRYFAKNQIRADRAYTVQELMEHSIKESDNVANKTLKTMVGDERLSKTYADLRMPEVELAADRGYTTQIYSHLFRALYNGTYLSKPTSEKVLDLLSQTSFNNGIVSGVPVGITVSHKFGVNSINPSGGAPYVELHDCGIVYHNETPYFICIMTRGSDYEVLESVLKDISKISWDYVDSSKQDN